MKRNRKKYSVFQQSSALFMLLVLLWLTVSIPFVYASQERIAKHDKIENSSNPLSGNEEETANPFGNTTEKKASGNTTFSEEYLHDHPASDYFFSIASQYHKCENADTYIAYHGELLVPPPNAA